MASLTPGGNYRGTGGPDPKKTRAEREQELLAMMRNQDGCIAITDLWKQYQNIPMGSNPPGARGALLRQQMIPLILAHEYPNS